MQRSEPEEPYKVSDVSMAYARANPRAMVVMHFNTHAASTAVECSRRSQDLASVAIR